MPGPGPADDAAILADAYAERVRDLFRIFAEAVYTGEPEREAVVRFRRGLLAARRSYTAALEAVKDADNG